MVFGALISVMYCEHVTQFLRLGCVLYVTALEAYWCTEASAALLLSLLQQLLQLFCLITAAAAPAVLSY